MRLSCLFVPQISFPAAVYGRTSDNSMWQVLCYRGKHIHPQDSVHVKACLRSSANPLRPTPPASGFPPNQEHLATFTCYPIVLHTEVSGERERNAGVGAGGISIAGGKRDQQSAVGGATPAASEITNIVNVGTYEDCDLLCDLKQHLQMNVRVGILSNLTGEGVELTGKLQLLDSKTISGNEILVLRQPQLSMPSQFRKIDWPCDPEAICKI